MNWVSINEIPDDYKGWAWVSMSNLWGGYFNVSCHKIRKDKHYWTYFTDNDRQYICENDRVMLIDTPELPEVI